MSLTKSDCSSPSVSNENCLIFEHSRIIQWIAAEREFECGSQHIYLKIINWSSLQSTTTWISAVSLACQMRMRVSTDLKDKIIIKNIIHKHDKNTFSGYKMFWGPVYHLPGRGTGKTYGVKYFSVGHIGLQGGRVFSSHRLGGCIRYELRGYQSANKYIFDTNQLMCKNTIFFKHKLITY